MTNLDQTKLFAGDTWNWTESLPDYSPNEYTARVALKLNNANAVVINASIVDGVFNFSYSSANTSNLPAGVYFYQYIATKDGNDYYSCSGYVEVYPNILTSATDMRGQWQRILDNLKTAYEAMLREGRIETTVSMNGRSITYNQADIIKAINNAEMKAREERGEGGFQSIAFNFQRR